jgi:hypothetical protein
MLFLVLRGIFVAFSLFVFLFQALATWSLFLLSGSRAFREALAALAFTPCNANGREDLPGILKNRSSRVCALLKYETPPKERSRRFFLVFTAAPALADNPG